MDWPAVFSLGSLILVLVVGSIVPRLNAGILAIAVAYVIGFSTGRVDPVQVAGGFPGNLFLMLLGVSLLFLIAEQNGTLERITASGIRLARGHTTLLPGIYFFLALLLSAGGPGNIAATALLAPPGLALAHRVGISPLLMSIMICTGANAGAFSPVAPTGIIGAGLLQRIGMTDPGLPLRIFVSTAGLQSLSALAAFALLSKWKTDRASITESAEPKESSGENPPLTGNQIRTLVAMALLVLCVIVLRLPVGPVAFVLVSVLWITNSQDRDASVRGLPWEPIFLLTGIAILISVLEKQGALDLVVSLITRLSDEHTINGVVAFLTGVASAFSSSSGVIMPTFLPMIPGIHARTPGADPVDLAISICVGAHMVDVSPLSTLGALCIASAPVKPEERTRLFRRLLLWGLSMSVVGGFLAWLFLDRL